MPRDPGGPGIRVADESAACWASSLHRGRLFRQAKGRTGYDSRAGERDVQTTVAVTGNNTGIVVPEKAIEQLAAGNRPPVLVTVNGYEYRNTVGVMGGKHLISISAAVRKATGLKAEIPSALP